MIDQKIIFWLATTVEVAVVNGSEFAGFLFACFDEQVDGDALFNIENIHVRRTVGAGLFFLGVAVQVERVDLVVGFQQVPTHAAKGRVVEKTVRIDKGQNSLAVLFDEVLSVSDEFYVVVVNPFRVFLFQLFLAAGFFFVVLHQLHDPLAFIGTFTGVRRIAEDDHDGRIAFDVVGLIGLGAEPVGEERSGVWMMFFERVG